MDVRYNRMYNTVHSEECDNCSMDMFEMANLTRVYTGMIKEDQIMMKIETAKILQTHYRKHLIRKRKRKRKRKREYQYFMKELRKWELEKFIEILDKVRPDLVGSFKDSMLLLGDVIFQK